MPGSKPGALPLGYTPELVSPKGFEPPTRGLEGRCSIQLSYEPLLTAITGGKTGSTVPLRQRTDYNTAFPPLQEFFTGKLCLTQVLILCGYNLLRAFSSVG